MVVTGEWQALENGRRWRMAVGWRTAWHASGERAISLRGCEASPKDEEENHMRAVPKFNGR